MSLLGQTLSAVFSPVQRAKRKAFKQLQAGQFTGAILSCDQILKADPQDRFGLSVLADVADAMTAAVERYKRDPSSEQEHLLRTRQLATANGTPPETPSTVLLDTHYVNPD